MGDISSEYASRKVYCARLAVYWLGIVENLLCSLVANTSGKGALNELGGLPKQCTDLRMYCYTFRQSIEAAKFGDELSTKLIDFFRKSQDFVGNIELGLTQPVIDSAKIAEEASAQVACLNGLIAEAQQIANTVTTPPRSKSLYEGATVFNFLHFTDLHAGHPGFDAAFDRIQSCLLDDIKQLEQRMGVNWDAVLFSGDLVFSGKVKGKSNCFKKLDLVLKALNQHWSSQGNFPPLLAVPGNHDVDWLTKDSTVKEILGFGISPEKAACLWNGNSSSPHIKSINKAFKQYFKWWQKYNASQQSAIGYSNGRLPGDFTATIEKNNISIGFLGLNSSFVQIAKTSDPDRDTGDFKGKLLVSSTQATQALPEGFNGIGEWTNSKNICFLMTHHPPDWLSDASRQDFNDNVYASNWFSGLFCGHLHEPQLLYRANALQKNGRHEWLGRSLYGRDNWRDGVQDKGRSHGYTAYQIIFPKGENKAYLRVWPRAAASLREWKLVPDHLCCEIDESDFLDGGSPPILLKSFPES